MAGAWRDKLTGFNLEKREENRAARARKAATKAASSSLCESDDTARHVTDSHDPAEGSPTPTQSSTHFNPHTMRYTSEEPVFRRTASDTSVPIPSLSSYSVTPFERQLHTPSDIPSTSAHPYYIYQNGYGHLVRGQLVRTERGVPGEYAMYY
jgi:hypothetical protein